MCPQPNWWRLSVQGDARGVVEGAAALGWKPGSSEVGDSSLSSSELKDPREVGVGGKLESTASLPGK